MIVTVNVGYLTGMVIPKMPQVSFNCEHVDVHLCCHLTYESLYVKLLSLSITVSILSEAVSNSVISSTHLSRDKPCSALKQCSGEL